MVEAVTGKTEVLVKVGKLGLVTEEVLSLDVAVVCTVTGGGGAGLFL